MSNSVKTVSIKLSQRTTDKVKLDNEKTVKRKQKDGKMKNIVIPAKYEKVSREIWHAIPFNVYVEDNTFDYVETAKLCAEIVDNEVQAKLIDNSMTSFSLSKKVEITLTIEDTHFVIDEAFITANASMFQLLKVAKNKKNKETGKSERIILNKNSFELYFTSFFQRANVLLQNRNVSIKETVKA